MSDSIRRNRRSNLPRIILRETDETFERRLANACNTKKNLGRTVSESYSDAMDKVKGGVSYPPNLADAKEETPNGTNGILCRTMDINVRTEEPCPNQICRKIRKESKTE